MASHDSFIRALKIPFSRMRPDKFKLWTNLLKPCIIEGFLWQFMPHCGDSFTMSSLMQSYNRLNFKPVSGNGAWVFDATGKEHLDALGGIAVCALGHSHPEVTRTICEQSSRLMHISNLYQIEAQEALGRQLCTHAQMDRAFISNSGAEANEAAIKLARLYASKQKVNNPQIVVMEGAFHGRTLATLSATGNRKIQAGFEPLVQGFLRAPYNDTEALRAIATNSKNVVAVFVEPIQGEAGIVMPSEGYLAEIRKICNEHNWLFMLDEIQTGMGRTGEWFAWMHEDAKPDILTAAKALGNGFPIGACLASGRAAEIITPGTHGSTFGGNPLGCSVASTVISEIDKNKLVARAGELGDRIMARISTLLKNCSSIVSIRGKGLMIGIELNQDCGQLMQAGIDSGILLNVAAGNVVRLLPPFILLDEEADQLANMISKLILDFANTPA